MLKKQNRFSIRKLTIGAVSCMIGSVFFLTTQETVKADSISQPATPITANKQVDNNQSAIRQVVNNTAANIEKNAAKTNISFTKQENNIADNKQDLSNNPAKISENNTTNTANNNSVKHISDNAAQTNNIAKTTEAQNNNQNNEQNKIAEENKNRSDNNNLTNNKLENNANTVINSVNGGFDEKTWGKLNVTDWDASIDGNYLSITGYHGTDKSHIIVPNGADFTNAGLNEKNYQTIAMPENKADTTSKPVDPLDIPVQIIKEDENGNLTDISNQLGLSGDQLIWHITNKNSTYPDSKDSNYPMIRRLLGYNVYIKDHDGSLKKIPNFQNVITLSDFKPAKGDTLTFVYKQQQYTTKITFVDTDGKVVGTDNVNVHYLGHSSGGPVGYVDTNDIKLPAGYNLANANSFVPQTIKYDQQGYENWYDAEGNWRFLEQYGLTKNDSNKIPLFMSVSSNYEQLNGHNIGSMNFDGSNNNLNLTVIVNNPRASHKVTGYVSLPIQIVNIFRGENKNKLDIPSLGTAVPINIQFTYDISTHNKRRLIDISLLFTYYLSS